VEKRFALISAVALLSVCCQVLGGTTVRENSQEVNTLVIHTDQGKHTIAPEIYGHFSEHLGRCVYDGLWVGPDSEVPNIRGLRKDIIEALKKIQIPVLRWPGGCFADEYHWKDGVGQRVPMLNNHWGRVIDDSSFGTHEFLDLCDLLGCKAYIAGNVGSGTVEEMQDWVEYMTCDEATEMVLMRKKNGRAKPWKIRYFGVGNENWGCGGNMTAQYYSDVYNRFQTYVRDYSGNDITKIACGPSGADYGWMETLMKNSARFMDAISVHYYVRARNGSATQFDAFDWFDLMKNTLRIKEIIEKHSAIMDKYDPEKRIGLYVDEWGTWWDVEPGTNRAFLYQQNTLRDAVSAGIFLNEFNKHCERVRMANIAQTVNVLQAMILTKGEKMVLTPTYHVFEMYNVHHGSTLIESDLDCNTCQNKDIEIDSLNASVSRDKSGRIHITVCNLDPEESAELECELEGFKPKEAAGRTLTHSKMNVHNTFAGPAAVKPGPLKGVRISGGKVLATLPAKSVTVITLK